MVDEIAQEREPHLTGREQQILELIADGGSAKQVARCIGIAPRTVERHIDNIRLKLHARNTPHAITRAYMNGALKVA